MARKNKKSVLITHEEPKAVLSEKFRGIRTNISFSGIDEQIKTVIITAEKPGAGKSTMTANTAVTYAQAGYKTLIIDGDMRKPTQHYIFNESNVIGLSNLIIQDTDVDEVIKPTVVENLFLLTSGPIPPNPSELISSEKFKSIFEELKKEYDIILIDTPPVITVTDAQIFASMAKNVVLIIDSEKNNRDEIVKARDLIEKAGAKVIGVILNKVAAEKSTSSYYYYYGEE